MTRSIASSTRWSPAPWISRKFLLRFHLRPHVIPRFCTPPVNNVWHRRVFMEMKNLVRSLLLVTALGGLAVADAPKKDAPKPTPTNEVPMADAEQFSVMYFKFVDIAVAAKEDCAKLTKDTNALIDGN